MHYFENRTFDELQPGERVELRQVLTRAEAEACGLTLLADIIANRLPGPGTVCVEQALHWQRAVTTGETLALEVTVQAKDPDTGVVTLACRSRNGQGDEVFAGSVRVRAPREKLRRPPALADDAPLHEQGGRYRQLIEATQDIEPIVTAVVHPCDALSITAVTEAAHNGLISPILVGPEQKIRHAADAAGCDLAGFELLDVPHSHAAAARAVALVHEGRAQALMKGALHTDELMAATLDARAGLRTERRMSHVFAFDVPHYPKPLFITDAAINIQPDLDTKRDIVQNAIDLAHALGIEAPKVAILSAVETVYSKIASTVEAAALCKMADRGQITGGILDGPLAFDNAISRAAAEAKHIVSPVAGDADVLVVPDLESGNMLAKQLVYLGGADSAGIVLGARVPIMLSSRSDPVLSRLAACALAQLFVNARSRGAV
ncbi:bifunctional enoyl-CoA hydratase/phosphate acetyltransferase [Dokdonella sp.]|uniref:bifunctional enoyl-CoA hydratase/phosphate acetyltransferase n=1 Tax=Dokdonella sp. TaxID=2291710 RepID=UPI0031C6FCF1|nr:bifunctional enoyl-CoA hydratase/phosphate acetyltransferase [Dokdonella sp.]